MISTVNTSAQLLAALKSASGGDTIRLAPGNYGNVSLKNVDFNSAVTVTSLDEDNPAVLTGLHMTGVSGLTFEHLEIAVAPDAAWNERLYVQNSERVTLSDLDVHGPEKGRIADQSLAFIRDSQDIQVLNSEFYRGVDGLSVLDTDHLKASGNSFHDLQTDGIRGGGLRDAEITDNRFTDFFPKPGDHPDGIQLWTTNTDYSSSDIIISGNIITRGEGDIVQGIFLRDQVGNLPFLRVVIENNFVSGGMWRGISVSGGKDVTMADNIVVGWPDQRSWIAADHIAGLKLTGNIATTLNIDPTASLLSSENQIIAIPLDQGVALLQSFLSRQSDTPAQSWNVIDGKNGVDRIKGTDRSDQINGLNGADYITGGGGKDWILGGTGDDRLFGELGDDILDGGLGNDVLTGGLGRDTLTGGAGADKFCFTNEDFVKFQASPDVITDFNAREGDKIALNGIDARAETLIRDKFAFVGTATFTGVAGQLRYTVQGGDAFVMADVNGDKVADLVIQLKQVTSLSASDFLL